MKKRKLIGVIISEAEGLYQHKLLSGIITECYSLDYDVAIFSTFIKDSGLPDYKIGEKNIFNLMNLDRFDGVIVAGQTLAIEKLPQEIETMLKQHCKCPVLYVDLRSKVFPYLYTDDAQAAEVITDHLIDCHGYKDIFCLAASPDSISTMTRVAGFKNSLRKHNIAIDESRISYEGDFYYPGGRQLASKLINGEIPMPEAVMCISDYMAIGLIDELVKNGIRVPEDIAVTGFDATDEAAACSTAVTTFLPQIIQTGVDAVCELTRLMTGVRTKAHNSFTGSLEIGNSCGCNDVDIMKRSGIIRLKRKTEDYETLLDSYMMEALTAVTEFKECIKKFCYFLYLLRDYSDYYLCLCEDGDDNNQNNGFVQDEILRVGYPDRMNLVFAYENREFVHSEPSFDTKDMLPDLWKDRAKPKAYYFTPLHFNDNTIGYSVLTYGDKVKTIDITYRNWSRNIMNTLEFNRVHKKLYQASFRDVLTGIYNRSGLDQNIPNIIKEGISQNKRLYVIMADLDNLKAINDGFGHQEGDNVIIIVANAFQSCSRGSDVCARIGGDEFVAVGIDVEDRAGKFISAVNSYIDNYNLNSNKNYKIEVSMGAFCGYIKEEKDIKKMLDRADHEMYLHKALNKHCRK